MKPVHKIHTDDWHTGHINDDEPWMQECANCLGTGAISITAIYEDEALAICEACGGSGLVEHRCP